MNRVKLNYILGKFSLQMDQSNSFRSLCDFSFKQDNGYQRIEDITYNKTSTETEKDQKGDEKPVEIRGGYSYISADGYEYTVKYKANKNGFQPYVTAHKLSDSPKQMLLLL